MGARLARLLRTAGISISACLTVLLIAGTQQAHATVIHGGHGSGSGHVTLGNRMLDWAETQAGKPYIWGGTGPYGYDCSGLVVAAAEHDGLVLPRTTYEMIWSRHLVRTWHPVRGDLAFFGPVNAPFHVEFVTVWRGSGFGALHSGVPVGYERWGSWWEPTAYYRIV